MVISLNGINEIDFISSEFTNNQNIFGSKMVISGFINDEVHFKDKIYTSSLINNLKLKIRKFFYKTNCGKLFFVLRKINSKVLDKNKFSPKYTILKNSIKKDLNLAANYWANNLKSMYSISKMQKINYFAFLQPTFGLDLSPYQLEKIVEIHNNENLNETHLVLKGNKPISNEYLLSINYLYSLLREKCKELSFCFDLSLDPNLNNNEKLYSDFRHHNQAGNKIISDNIFSTIKNILKN